MLRVEVCNRIELSSRVERADCDSRRGKQLERTEEESSFSSLKLETHAPPLAHFNLYESYTAEETPRDRDHRIC